MGCLRHGLVLERDFALEIRHTVLPYPTLLDTRNTPFEWVFSLLATWKPHDEAGSIML